MDEPEIVGESKDEEKRELITAEAMLELILSKEDEIRRRISKAELESGRMVEEAKLDAAAIKREAVTADIGRDLREKELAKAREEVRKIASDINLEAEKVKAEGMARIEEAVKLVLERVLPR